jgi:hypothetical protein
LRPDRLEALRGGPTHESLKTEHMRDKCRRLGRDINGGNAAPKTCDSAQKTWQLHNISAPKDRQGQSIHVKVATVVSIQVMFPKDRCADAVARKDARCRRIFGVRRADFSGDEALGAKVPPS